MDDLFFRLKGKSRRGCTGSPQKIHIGFPRGVFCLFRYRASVSSSCPSTAPLVDDPYLEWTTTEDADCSVIVVRRRVRISVVSGIP